MRVALQRFRFILLMVAMALQGAPAWAQVDTGEQLLSKLRALDSLYTVGFTGNGTTIHVPLINSSLPPRRVEWKISLAEGEIAYEERTSEILVWNDVLAPGAQRPPKQPGNWALKLRSTVYFDATSQSQYEFFGPMRSPGKLGPFDENGPGLATAGTQFIDRPDAATYRGIVDDVMWSLGRGYAKYIKEIKEISENDDGTIAFRAEGTFQGGRPAKWEITVDPKAAYMVRTAKQYRGEKTTASLEYSTSGTKWEGGLSAPESSEVICNRIGLAIRIPRQTLSISAKPDRDFIEKVASTMRPPYRVNTDVTDERTEPPGAKRYKAGEVYPANSALSSASALRKATEDAAREIESSEVADMPDSATALDTAFPISHSSKATPVDMDSPGTTDEQPSTERAHGTRTWIAAAVLLAFLMTGVVYILYRRKGNQRQSGDLER